MDNVYFNSWQEQFRTPFGAVKEGTDVRFRIRVDLPNVIYVALVIQLDDAGQIEQKMMKRESNFFITTYHFDRGSGLYFYYFKIVQQGFEENLLYYGNNADQLGGEGKLTTHYNNLHKYQLTCYKKEDVAPKWYQEAVFYHIFVDRFYNGEEDHQVLNPKKNTFIYATKEDTPCYIKDQSGEILRWDFFGGNLKGIIKKLDYLKKLGVTALYLSPIFEARSNHKYDTGDFRKIDPMFGDETIFKQLLDACHASGIHVILDGVFNHVGVDSRYFNKFGNYDEVGGYQSKKSVYADWFAFQEFPDQYRCWWGVKDLPTVNHQVESYQKFIYKDEDSIVKSWLRFGIDGWRIDVADELSDEFLAGIYHSMKRENADTVLIGEVWEDASNKISYQKRRHYLDGGVLHGVMNYPFKECILGLLNGKMPPRRMALQTTNLKENYPKNSLFNSLNNVGTHDTARVLTVLSNQVSKLRLAVGLLFVLPGVPCVYYGDEAGLTGGVDPDNRKFFPWENIRQDIYEQYHIFIQLRKNHKALKYGDYFPFFTEALFGVLRYMDEQDFVVFIVNVSDQKQVIEPSSFVFLEKEVQLKKLLQQSLEIVEIDPDQYLFFSSIDHQKNNDRLF